MTASRHFVFRRSRGFTLIELLVVIGIMVLLIGILTPMLMTAWKTAGRTKLAADFGVIAQGLEEYKKDHQGQYPSVNLPNTGFAVLGKALVGVYGDGYVPGTPPTPDPDDPPTFSPGKPYSAGDCVQTSAVARVVAIRENTGVLTGDTTNNQAWVPFAPNDLEDGLGSRFRVGGKKTPAYLQPERFKVRGCALLDPDGFPILYFPAKQSKPNLTKALPSGDPPFISLTDNSLFNVGDNLIFFRRPYESPTPDLDDTRATARFAALMGDINNNGRIDTGEQPASTGPFLLWAPGPDGLYGPVTRPSTVPPGPLDITKCDDVTNFNQ